MGQKQNVYSEVIATDEDGAASLDIAEMLYAEAPKNVQIVIQTGGATRWSNNLINPNKTQRFLIKNGSFEEISMEDRELEVRAKLDRLPKTFRFEALLDDCEDLPMFIATFLAVLDLARQHILAFTVDDEDVIWFSRGTGL